MQESAHKITELQGKLAAPNGKIRGLIIRPEQLIEAIQRAWENVPIPPDAIFKAIRISDGSDAVVEIYYTTLLDPLNHCFTIKPKTLLKVLAYWMDGWIPGDAELKAICVHPQFTIIRMDIQSDRFPSRNDLRIPMMHFRMESGELYAQNDANIAKMVSLV